MKRRNFLGLLLGTIGALPFVKAETFLAPATEYTTFTIDEKYIDLGEVKDLEIRGELGQLFTFEYAIDHEQTKSRIWFYKKSE